MHLNRKQYTKVFGEESTEVACIIIIVIIYTYYALINALSAHIIHINLNTIFYTHVEDSPTKTIDITYYMQTRIHTQ